MQIPITYEQLIKLRSDLNLILHVSEIRQDLGLWRACISIDGIIRYCDLFEIDPEFADLQARVLNNSLENKSIDTVEVRFQTHDYANVSTWDGRTTGDPAAWAAGGVVQDPYNFMWLNAAGAEALGQNDLYTARQHYVTPYYDDVNYKWVNASGTVLAQLDTTTTPAVWKDGNGDAIVEYDGVTDRWLRVSDNADVTSSRWRIMPYSGRKIQINQAWLRADDTVQFGVSGTLRYQAMSFVPAHFLSQNNPPFDGIWKGKEFVYNNVSDFIAGTNGPPYTSPTTLAGHDGPVMTMGYDYKDTVPQVIDSLLGQYLDIVLDDNIKMTNTLSAQASFICLNIRSF